MTRKAFLAAAGSAALSMAASAAPWSRRPAQPLRLGIAGLVHDHVHGILGRKPAQDIEIAGIAEPNRELAQRYAARYGFSMDRVFDTLAEMVEKTRPEAVADFGPIRSHLDTVECCAPKGIHVMVEKPLAVSYGHAERMVRLAEAHRVHLLTNYETTWYGSHAEAWRLVRDAQAIGPVRRLVFHTGHPGPAEIGCSAEFLEWLTDPALNGGGALTDFGCYGANLATWLLGGAAPERVACITRQVKPGRYPRVDDDATILLAYRDQTQVLIQASWNWPFNRKETEIYGTDGYVHCLDASRMRIMRSGAAGITQTEAPPLPEGRHDPFAWFAGVIQGSIAPARYDLSSPANNAIVIQILDAARQAALSGKTQEWSQLYG